MLEIKGTEIVDRIDTLLKNRNIKRAYLAEKIGISQQSFTDWKRRNTVPTADVAYKIAKFLGVSIEWLLTGEERPPPDNESVALAGEIQRLDASHREILLATIEAMKRAQGVTLTGTA